MRAQAPTADESAAQALDFARDIQPHAREVLLRVPRTEEGQGAAAAPRARRSCQRWRVRPGHCRRGRASDSLLMQRVLGLRRRRSHAARCGSAARGCRSPDLRSVDRSGARDAGSDGTATAQGSAPARTPSRSTGPTSSRCGPRCRSSPRELGAHADRSFRPRAARDARSSRPRPKHRKPTLLCGASRSISPGCRRRRPSSMRSSPTPSPDAYERVVDRLLASPHYGERWARPWLDLARYADTNGYEKDNRRGDLEVPRLGDRRAQPRHAVRPVHDRADRRRHAAERDHRRSRSPPASIATR